MAIKYRTTSLILLLFLLLGGSVYLSTKYPVEDITTTLINTDKPQETDDKIDIKDTIPDPIEEPVSVPEPVPLPPKPPVDIAEHGNEPKSILQNKQWNNYVYAPGSLGKQWEAHLLDVTNVAWWKEREDNMREYDLNYFESEEFRTVFQDIQDKTNTDGKKLMDTCKAVYDKPYRKEHKNKGLYRDAWVFCTQNKQLKSSKKGNLSQ